MKRAGLPNGWKSTTLGAIREDRTRSIDPRKSPDEVFDLYSVPAHPTGVPEPVTGRTIGSSKRLVEPNTVLVCKINPRINRTWVVAEEPRRRQIASTEWIPFSPVPDVGPRFLAYFMQQEEFRQHLATNVSGVGGSLMRVRPRVLEEFSFAYPSLDQQDRLVAKLDELFSDLDAGVAALEHAKANLARYRAAVLKAAVEGKLTEQWRQENPDVEPASELLKRVLKERQKKWEQDQLAKYEAKGTKPPAGWKDKYRGPVDPDDPRLPPLPDGWCWASIEQVASGEPRSIQSGPFGSNLLHSEFQHSGILAIGIDNVLDGQFSMGSEHRISEERFKDLKKYQARPLDVVVTVMATVGRCCVLPKNLETAIITKHVYRISVDQRLINPFFLQLAISSSSRVRRQLLGSVRGQTRPGINGSILRTLAVPIPSLAEQALIIAEAHTSQTIGAKAARTVDVNNMRSQGLRQAILKRAFSGALLTGSAAGV